MNLKHAPISGNLTAGVNGYLTDGKFSDQRSKYRSMISEILQRIESRLKAVNLEPAVASTRAGLSKDAIRNIQRAVKNGSERSGISTATLIQLAPVLETTAAWLIEGVDCGAENMPPSMRRLWSAFVAAADTSAEVQARIADFAEYQLSSYAKSRETATNPVS